MSQADFVHLQVHSMYSPLESTVRIPSLVAKAKELNMSALALTDHGNMCGAIEFYNNCKKNGIKPIFGCEVYLKNEAAQKESRLAEDKLKATRLVLLAKNFEGYQEFLNKDLMA